MNEKAARIARTHLETANPSMWNGLGKRPADFDERIVTYPLGGGVRLGISFGLEEGDGWLHCCELRDMETGELLVVLHGYGIDSPMNLADTIEDICSEIEDQ